jgi:hypothetical protein
MTTAEQIRKIKGTAHAPYVRRYLIDDTGTGTYTRALEVEHGLSRGWFARELDLVAVPVIGRFVATHEMPEIGFDHFDDEACDRAAERVLGGRIGCFAP